MSTDRELGFYWVRRRGVPFDPRDSYSHPFVAEWLGVLSPPPGWTGVSEGRWGYGDDEDGYAESELEVVSERLLPPEAFR